jgi:hypothetical protein
MQLRGHFVLAHLVTPSEKFFGRLEEMSPMGFVLRGVNVESFEDWLRDFARGERDGMGLVTMFVPLHRLERMFLDERVGGVESYREVFERRVRRSIDAAFASTLVGASPADDAN